MKYLKKKRNLFALNIFKVFAAFTLSEVLITLSIIGIIAAITIPIIMKNNQDAELKAAFKKTFAILSDAALRIKDNNGGTFVGFFSSTDDARNKFLQYLSYIKTCNANSVSTDCWSNNTVSEAGQYTYPNSSRAVLTNGVLVSFWGDQSDTTCSNPVWNPPPGGFCMVLMVDTNGFKGPNLRGKDIFALWLTKNGIILDTKNTPVELDYMN